MSATIQIERTDSGDIVGLVTLDTDTDTIRTTDPNLDILVNYYKNLGWSCAKIARVVSLVSNAREIARIVDGAL